MLFQTILMVLGFVLFFLAGIGIPSPQPNSSRWNLVALGLACWILAEILFRNLGKG